MKTAHAFVIPVLVAGRMTASAQAHERPHVCTPAGFVGAGRRIKVVRTPAAGAV
jgi:hypothetical protein